jgi:hypothetical protein
MSTVTRVLIIVAIIALAIYDIVALAYGGVEATISFILLDWSYKCPALPFAAGFLCGHLFWPNR